MDVTLVDKGLTILETVLLEANAAGVNTTDISNPPDANIGAMSMGNFRLWDKARGL